MAKLVLSVEVQSYGEDEEDVLIKLRDTLVQVVSLADLSVGTFCTSNIEKSPSLATPPKHVEDAIFEVADAAANPTGYADDEAEADRRAKKRDDLVLKISALVKAETA